MACEVPNIRELGFTAFPRKGRWRVTPSPRTIYILYTHSCTVLSDCIYDGMGGERRPASTKITPEYSGVGFCGISSERPLAGHTLPTYRILYTAVLYCICDGMRGERRPASTKITPEYSGLGFCGISSERPLANYPVKIKKRVNN